ncbi:MAG TPA: hypothetical protein PLD14_02950 [Candidatus Pacearchaeota archaeon]|nr:hypothetical protein [Candidatus Pacearchaeota archaeon]HPR80157.1 hypothetical protein [Candidatus Pacearchaeota archaeon]
MKEWIKILIIMVCLITGPFLFSLLIEEEPKVVSVNNGLVAKIKRTIDTSNWGEYINAQLGFSIKIPPETQCIDRCGGSKDPLVPVKVFQDNNNNAVYITPEYYYDYRKEKCEKIEASLASLQAQGKTVKPFLAWKIDVIKVDNLEDIKKFIKDYYPENCIFGDQKINDNGTYDISIIGNDWANGEIVNSTCPYEMHYKILYSPEKKKLISVKLPIDYDFFIYNDSPGGLDDYGQEMIKSLKFE